MEPEYWAPLSCALNPPEDLTDGHHRAATKNICILVPECTCSSYSTSDGFSLAPAVTTLDTKKIRAEFSKDQTVEGHYGGKASAIQRPTIADGTAMTNGRNTWTINHRAECLGARTSSVDLGTPTGE